MARVKQSIKAHCRWTEDDDGNWWSDCGEAFVLTDGSTPTEHGMRFCCYCGKLLTSKKV